MRGAADEAELSPFWGIEKGAVLQESRVFHDQQLDARQCAQVITKLLYLINQGEHFTKTEATEVRSCFGAGGKRSHSNGQMRPE